MTPERWQRVAQVCESALELDPSQRAAFVADACGTDESLRREVESLLAHEGSPVVLEQGIQAVAAGLTTEAALPPGTHLGPYRLERLVGSGGMGQVYRATDTRLNRIVAVKVLPHGLAHDEQFRARFDREAHTIAGLTHAHICTLYDVGRQDDTDYLVLEYLEGETLAARLERGALPFEQALTCALQMAEALDAAHRRGIVHRDLKPGNIFLVRGQTGSAPPTVKLLDFGLAKPATPAIVDGTSSVPTTPHALTAQGTILGTFQYMAPEQLEGREADTRTDIFAFGTVVYEMFTGKKAFEGKSQASLIGAIMHVDPPAISSLQPLTPQAFDRVVKRCLAKDPDERWQTARDLISELRWVTEVAAQSQSASAPRRSSSRREMFAWTLALLAIATAGIALWRRTGTGTVNDTGVIVATVQPPAGVEVGGVRPSSILAMSPDGKQLAFVGVDTPRGRRRLYVRSLDSMTARVLEGSDGAFSPFWSHDSRTIAFFAGGRLKKVEASGGAVQTVRALPRMSGGAADNPPVIGGTWNASGAIVFGGSGPGGLFLLNPAAGEPRPLMKNGAYPFFLPDGRHFVYRSQGPGTDGDGIAVGDIDSGEGRVIVADVLSQPMFSQGHLIYVRDQTLLAQRFDQDRLAPTGDATPIASPVWTGFAGWGAFSVSAVGNLAYQGAGGHTDAPSQLVWFDRTGGRIGSVGEEAAYLELALSYDGRQLVASVTSPGTFTPDLVLFDLARGGISQQFTSTPEMEDSPVWSPDNAHLLYRRSTQLFKQRLDAVGGATQLPEAGFGWSWSHDGRVLYSDAGNLRLRRLDDGEKPIPLPVPIAAACAQFAPNANWFAFHARDNDELETFVAPLPGHPGRITKISTDGGGWPRWSRDGKQLFFLSNFKQTLMVVDVHRDGDVLRTGTPKKLFDVRTKIFPFGWPYDIAPDGRILVNVRSDGALHPPPALIINWPALLNRRSSRSDQ